MLNAIHFVNFLYKPSQRNLDFHSSYPNHMVSKFHELNCIKLILDLLFFLFSFLKFILEFSKHVKVSDAQNSNVGARTPAFIVTDGQYQVHA